MGEYYVADSYKNFEYDETKAYEKSGKLYVDAKCKCDRCMNGVFVCRVENNQPVPHPAYGGVCLKCGGTGFVKKSIRLYTAKEKAALDRQAIRRAEKKAEEEKNNNERLAKESEANKREWLEKNGFNEEGITYVAIGNTYEIKETLKEKGCRFSPVLKWHCAEKFDLPEDYKWIEVKFDDVLEWNMYQKNAYFFETAKSFVEKLEAQAEGPSKSEYVGEVGERLRNITAIYKSCRGFEGRFGWTNIYTFESEENILVWFTSSELTLKKGDIVNLTGTIKKHEEFRGVKTTQLSRCIVKTIA